MHGPIAETYIPVIAYPYQGVFEPVVIVALRIVLAGLRSPALRPVCGRLDGSHCLRQQVLEFHSFNEVRIPDQRSVRDGHVGERGESRLQRIDTLL